MTRALPLLLSLLACGAPVTPDLSGPVADWPSYGGTDGGLRFSPLTQITPENVGELDLAWVHYNGDVSDGTGDTTPLSKNMPSSTPDINSSKNRLSRKRARTNARPHLTNFTTS